MKKLIPIALIFDLLILDQLTKWAARNYLERPVEVLSFFDLRFVENEGIAFSMPVSQYFIIPLTFVVMGWLGWQIWENTKSKEDEAKKELSTLDSRLWTTYAYAFIFAGAAGNLIDRLLFGKVTDFLAFWNFPVFNLADTWITIGVGIFVLTELKSIKN